MRPEITTRPVPRPRSGESTTRTTRSGREGDATLAQFGTGTCEAHDGLTATYRNPDAFLQGDAASPLFGSQRSASVCSGVHKSAKRSEKVSKASPMRSPYRSEVEHRQDCLNGCARVMALRHTPATCRSRFCALNARRSSLPHISIVLRMRPTARPSISKGSPGWTMIVG